MYVRLNYIESSEKRNRSDEVFNTFLERER
jgi:hypothetical protein